MPNLGGGKVKAIACGSMHSAIILEDGTPLFFGDNKFGQTNVPDLGERRADAVACGSDHSAIVVDDQVILFENNDQGQIENSKLKLEYIFFKRIVQEDEYTKLRHKGTVKYYNSDKGYGFIGYEEQGQTKELF